MFSTPSEPSEQTRKSKGECANPSVYCCWFRRFSPEYSHSQTVLSGYDDKNSYWQSMKSYGFDIKARLEEKGVHISKTSEEVTSNGKRCQFTHMSTSRVGSAISRWDITLAHAYSQLDSWVTRKWFTSDTCVPFNLLVVSTVYHHVKLRLHDDSNNGPGRWFISIRRVWCFILLV